MPLAARTRSSGRPGRGPGRRRVQRHRHRARRGDRRGRRGRRLAGGAADQRELREIPRRARARSPRACLAIARAAAVPVAVHLDHATERGAGRGGRPRSGSARSCSTRRAPLRRERRGDGRGARWCHERGVWVEAELGEIGGKDGVHAPGARTDPARRRASSRRPGWTRSRSRSAARTPWRPATPVLDLDLIARLRDGGPRTAGAARLVRRAGPGPGRRGRAGMTKINIATQLNKVFTAAVRQTCPPSPRRSIRGGTGRRDATRSRRR